MPSSSSFINVVVTAKGCVLGPQLTPPSLLSDLMQTQGLNPTSPSQQHHIPVPLACLQASCPHSFSQALSRHLRLMCPSKLLLPLFPSPHLASLLVFPGQEPEAPRPLLLLRCLAQWHSLLSPAELTHHPTPPRPAQVTWVPAATSLGGLKGLLWGACPFLLPFLIPPPPLPQPQSGAGKLQGPVPQRRQPRPQHARVSDLELSPAGCRSGAALMFPAYAGAPPSCPCPCSPTEGRRLKAQW